MKHKIYLFFFLTLLKYALSLRLNNTLSKKNNFVAEKYFRKENDNENLKFQIIDDLEKINEEFSNDVNTAKIFVRDTFLDTEASFKEISDDVVKIISKYSFSIDEKLNVLNGLLQEFIENNKSSIFNSSDENMISHKNKIKEVSDSILCKLKKLIELNIFNKYHAILKFGNQNIKNETLEALRIERKLSDKLKKELLKYKTLENEDIKESESTNFLKSVYNKFIVKLDEIINEMSKELSHILL
ncbi:sporozoite protein essential for cell traversal, putative [Plasmodium gallinaceum]|uniref:Sporozoite protein essential for cell traversal, putative n=1 Tax=Plasmodium gallinaceum TaxID=5849 RepID=A0A1J1GVT5_PLAGA|nr:sporozoite protein essential for cell traversal, putative [Plasmodium gallinaceum]CRG95131.1 sporozoite protein essential for cell traversal, putative [Plasmodium gallinaceum]